jgi:hypothetical protein
MGLLGDMWNAFQNGVEAGETLKRGSAAPRPPARGGDSAGLVEGLCHALGWDVDERQGNFIALFFRVNGEADRRVCVVCGEAVLVFFTLSNADFRPRDLPPELPAALLRRNDDLFLSAWAMDTEDDEVSLSCRYCVAPDALTPEFFKRVCLSLVNEVTEFDARLSERGLMR